MLQTLVLGRSNQADIRFDDSSISRAHAELTQSHNGDLFIIDRLSTHGTFIYRNNAWQRLSQGYVGTHEQLKLGDLAIAVSELAQYFRTSSNTPPSPIEPLSIKPRRNKNTGEIELG